MQLNTDIHAMTRLVTICAWCQRVRDTHGHWQPTESREGHRVDVRFTHALCPDCADDLRSEYGLDEAI